MVANAGAVWENRPDSLYGSTSGWVAFWTRYRDGTVVVSGYLEGHTFCVALGVDRASGYSSAPLQGKSFRKAVSAVMDYL